MKDIIFGIHSICAAVENPRRINNFLHCTEDGLSDIKKKLKKPGNINKIEVNLVSSHKLQELAKKEFKEQSFDFQRVPSGAFLISDSLEEPNLLELYEVSKLKGKRILCLDQLSDVHNGGAILRTASFYGVDAIVMPGKNSFGSTPTYFRIASGAHEYLKIFRVNNLSKTITKLKQNGSAVIALSEHSEHPLDRNVLAVKEASITLVLGKEETGISNAVARVIDHHMRLPSQGEIRSLNVSVAAAIALEKCFGIS